MAENAFGKWLKKNRKALGFSQAELAEFLKTYQVKISHWETGEDRPAEETVRELEELFEPRRA
ncbi:MAG: helix-turn-helix transcriptional regulator [bacterium]|nr:helix-turn-helix transcriptional regulator [bacterium]